MKFTKETPFDLEVKRLLDILSKLPPDSEQYFKVVDNLKVLCQAQAEKPTGMPSPDAIFTSVIHILGVFAVINHENINIITSKAWGMIWKPKY